MVSIKNVVFALTAFVATVKADYIINPESVSLSLRTAWCASELSQCPLICQQISGGVITNTCDPKALTYGCVCTGNQRPNVSEYTLTLPYFTCVEWGNQCVAGCGQDNECSRSCREDNPCGALNPTKPNITSSATQSATASTKTGASATQSNVVYTGLGNGASGGGASTPNGSSALHIITLGGSVGLFSVVAGLVSGFIFLL